MATHEFGILNQTPGPGERYDAYRPDLCSGLVAVDDEWLEPLLPRLDEVDFFWHSLRVPGKGLAYCGITLIPPTSAAPMLRALGEAHGLLSLRELLRWAEAEGRYVIHYGL